MKDPLRIFTKEQLNSLNDYNLKRLKKEFFIPFKFGGETSLTLNKHEVDQATLEAIFEELEINLDEYLIVIKNKSLGDFFENGNIGFLYNDGQYNEINELLKGNPKLESRIANKLSDVIARISQNINGNTLNALKALQDFTSDFDSQNIEKAYQKTYEDLDNFTTDLWAKHISPFQNNHGVQYKSEMGLLVNLIKARTFDYLPESFKILDKKYSQWCSIAIVIATTVRQTDLKNFKKRDLRIFIEASNIATRHYDTEELQYNLKAANAALKGGSSNISGLSCIGFILVIFTVIKIIASVVDYSSHNYSSSRQSKSENEKIAELYKRMQRLNHEKQIKEANEKAKTNEQSNLEKAPKKPAKEVKPKSKEPFKFVVTDKTKAQKNTEPVGKNFKGNYTAIQLSKQYVGGNWELLNTRYKQSKVKGDNLVVNYDTESIPTDEEELTKLLPAKVQKEGPGKYSTAILSFSNREMNIKSSHLIDIIYNIDDQPPSYVYSRKEPVNNAKMTLSTKRIPYKDFNIKGQILLKDTDSGKTKEKLHFRITYDRINKIYQVTYGNNENLTLTLDESKKTYLIDDKNVIAKKFGVIINNLNQLHNKFLKEKNWYSIEYIKEYSLIVGGKIRENATNFETHKGNLRYNFTSSIDNLSYCELRTKNTAFKYVFDQKSGILKGMIKATTTYTKNEVEQVMVFRQE